MSTTGNGHRGSKAEIAQFGWLVNQFIDRTPGVAHAAVVSSDGFLLTVSDNIPRERAEQMAAVSSGLVSLTGGAARVFNAGRVLHTMIEMEQGYLLLMSISDDSSFTVLAGSDTDIGVVTYEMTLLVERFGTLLTPELRADLRGSILS